MIDVIQVTKKYGDTVSVNNVSLKILEGEFVALLGPNGAGKTTLVEMIEGFQPPDSGAIYIDGKTWRRDAPALHRLLGISLQETKLIDKLSVYDTLCLFGSFYGEPKSRSDEVLEILGLSHKKNTCVTKLSGGQRQKVILGLSWIHRPKILILDEPTVGLDPNSRQELWTLLQAFKQNGVTLLLTTHYMEEASTLCERIVMMNQGQLVADGSLETLVATHGGLDKLFMSVTGRSFDV